MLRSAPALWPWCLRCSCSPCLSLPQLHKHSTHVALLGADNSYHQHITLAAFPRYEKGKLHVGPGTILYDINAAISHFAMAVPRR